MLGYRDGMKIDAEMQEIQPGDMVTIRGEVKQVVPGVGVRVELFSKTDQYSGWVRPDLIVDHEIDGAGLDPEPGNGRWVRIGPADGPLLWYRNDAEGHPDPERRFNRTWWSYEAQDWVDWPHVNAEMERWSKEGYAWELVEIYKVTES